MKANQKTLHRQIASQFQEKRTIPLVATDQEISHGGGITWTLQAKEAPQHICESWVGASWIVEMTATGTRDARPFQASHLFLTRGAPPHRPCCNWCGTAGVLSAGTGSVTPCAQYRGTLGSTSWLQASMPPLTLMPSIPWRFRAIRALALRPPSLQWA